MSFKTGGFGPQFLGIQNIGDTFFANPPGGTMVGQEVEGFDTTNTYWGKFKLLFGVANTVVGSLVTYDPSTGLTTLSATSPVKGAQLAVAMSANTSTTTLAWYQVQGVATIKKNATKISPQSSLYQSATAGRVTATLATGKEFLNMVTVNAATVASATSTVLVSIQYPNVITSVT